MKLNKVLAVRKSAKNDAAQALAEAQSALAETEAQVMQISELSEEYAQGVALSSSAYQLQQRVMFFEQLMKTRQIQERHVVDLRYQLEQRQAQFAHLRSEEKLLKDLIAKREALHTYQLRKKLAKAQISRTPTKL